MKTLSTAIVVALIGAPAFAADLAVKAPPPALTSVYNWTGFYVGGNVGIGWSTAHNNIAFTQTDTNINSGVATFNAQDSANFNGLIGGAQAGYSWQVSNFLLGIESDIQAAGQSGANNFSGAIFNPVLVGVANPASGIEQEKLDWFGTVRGRLGLTFDRWLVYGTGGLAYGKIELLMGSLQPANPFSFPRLGIGITNAPIVWGHSSTVNTGWVAGAGIENQFNPHWSWKVEYLLMDMGSVSSPLSGGIGAIALPRQLTGNCYGNSGGCVPYGNPASGTNAFRLTENIVRFGLNYQFH